MKMTQVCVMAHEAPKGNLFERFAAKVTRAAGSTGAFVAALLLVIGWVFSGPLFHYSQNWQLFINTGTTIVTFLMVFIIQKSQNKDSLAIQLKLNELVSAHEFASNHLVDVESMTEDEMRVIQKYYTRLSEYIRKNGDSKHAEAFDKIQERIRKQMESELEKKVKK